MPAHSTQNALRPPSWPVKITARYGRPKIKLPPEIIATYGISAPSTASLLTDQVGNWWLDPLPPDNKSIPIRHGARKPITIYPVDVRRLGNSIYIVHRYPWRQHPLWAKGRIVAWIPDDAHTVRLVWIDNAITNPTLED